MKCEELKQLLESNDEKNARIKANTIECFEQIKDFVVDELIQESIKSNFCEGGHYIDGVKIYRKIFEIKGVDARDIWSWTSILDWEDEFKLIDQTPRIYLEGDQKTEFEESVDAINGIFDYFDRGFFKNLVENHLKTYGFRKVKAKSIRGETLETERFYASRSTIEKICCHDAKPSQTEDNEEKNNGAIFAVVILVVILMALSFIIL